MIKVWWQCGALVSTWWFSVENRNGSLSLSVSCMLGRWPAKGEPHLLPSISSDRFQPAGTNDTELDKRLGKWMSEKLGLTHPMGLWWFIIITKNKLIKESVSDYCTSIIGQIIIWTSGIVQKSTYSVQDPNSCIVVLSPLSMTDLENIKYLQELGLLGLKSIYKVGGGSHGPYMNTEKVRTKPGLHSFTALTAKWSKSSQLDWYW